ncbi:DUF2971 domain-containing protein [Herbaspirillum sp. YR522]|uniref:DUF2971 domain-containing protein n=1 Tax=Herbaspirillum sp. YR522 TaxID=1144342 RepID=UPI00026F763F|nr:DUF2971 domain-containing protein [Herbaspirillum sp. YR522]EJN09389.1 Protein of unknown function (DUF2971) [Herbaspirillum sp. YR522]
MKPSILLGAPEREERRRITVRTRRPYPIFLYKYRPQIDKWVEKTLLDSEIFLSSRSQFNDPMDIVYQVTPAATDEIRWKRYAELVKSQGGTYEDLRTLWRAAGTPDSEIASQRRVLDQIIDTTGIHSLSETARSMLMWSHYADDHKGICLQFYLPAGFEAVQGLFPVEYGDEMKTLEYRNPETNHLAPFKFKSQEWKYEQEWRILRPMQAKTSLSLPHAMLKGIIFGSRCPLSVKQHAVKINEQRIEKGMHPLYMMQTQLSQHYYHIGISSIDSTLPAGWRGRRTTRSPLGFRE